MKLIRTTGVILGLFVLSSGLTYNTYVSEKDQMLQGMDLWGTVILFVLFSIPLLAPWTCLQNHPNLWTACFVLLCLLAAISGYRLISDTLWAFRYGEYTQKIMFPALWAFFLTIVALHIPIALEHRKRTEQCDAPK